MDSNITAKEVAQWMLDRIKAQGELLQPDAVVAIKENFGECFLRVNDEYNTVLSKEVIKAFRRLTEKTVVWEPAPSFRWRFRREGDEPGRTQRGTSMSIAELTGEDTDDINKVLQESEDAFAALLNQPDLQIAEIDPSLSPDILSGSDVQPPHYTSIEDMPPLQ